MPWSAEPAPAQGAGQNLAQMLGMVWGKRSFPWAPPCFGTCPWEPSTGSGTGGSHPSFTAQLGGPCPKPHVLALWGGSSCGPIGTSPGPLQLLPLFSCAFFWVPSLSRVINASCYTASRNKSLLFPIPW